MGLHQIIQFWHSKGYNNQNQETSYKMEEKIFASYQYYQWLIYRIYKELQKLSTKRSNNPINKWENELNRQFSEVQTANKTWRNFQHPYL
jgi:hypothetical protein